MNIPSPLPAGLLERVLERLGFSQRPEISPAGLAEFYAAWCQRVPFDNVRKLIHIAAGDPAPLPGSSAIDFLEAWLQHGTGGTCWAGAGAVHAMLQALGFEARRGLATMMAAPDLPPNHGTVAVDFDGLRQLVDSSILCGEPLTLDEHRETRVDHPAWGLSCAPRESRWHLTWRPLNRTDGLECRLEHFDAQAADFADFHERTREWSPFNYQLHIRINRGEEVLGAAFGQAVRLGADGSVSVTPLDTAGRHRLLIDVVGLSEEIVSRLPADRPTPPPPGSRTALAAS